jgi:hypothetical protein
MDFSDVSIPSHNAMYLLNYCSIHKKTDKVHKTDKLRQKLNAFLTVHHEWTIQDEA